MQISCCFPRLYILSPPTHNDRIIQPGSCNDSNLFNYFVLDYFLDLSVALEKIASIQDVSFIYFDMTDLKIAKYVGLNI